MGKLVIVVGNTGVGKTSLTRALCTAGNFTTGLEGHSERPFQALFKADRRYALANQIDYLLRRAEQERMIRSDPRIGIQDGGLDMDFYVFTRLFHQKGFLSAEEFALCKRLHTQVRTTFPPAEVIVRLIAPAEVVAERFARRSRPLEIAERDDLQVIENLLDDWLYGVDAHQVLAVDASEQDPTYSSVLPLLLKQISSLLVHA